MTDFCLGKGEKKWELTFAEHLLSARHHAKCLTGLSNLNYCNSPLWWVAFSSCYRFRDEAAGGSVTCPVYFRERYTHCQCQVIECPTPWLLCHLCHCECTHLESVQCIDEGLQLCTGYSVGWLLYYSEKISSEKMLDEFSIVRNILLY